MEKKIEEIIELMAYMDTGEEMAVIAAEAMQSPQQCDLMLEYLNELVDKGKMLTEVNLLTAIVIIHNKTGYVQKL